MREFEFVGTNLTNAVLFITDAWTTGLNNFTISEIRIKGVGVLSQLATPTGSETACDKDILNFLRKEVTLQDLKAFALKYSLTLTRRDQNAKIILVALSALTALDVNTITWQKQNIVRIAFNSTPNLSTVKAGDQIKVTTATNAANNGTFEIVGVNDASDYVDIVNTARTSATGNEATNSPAVGNIWTIL